MRAFKTAEKIRERFFEEQKDKILSVLVEGKQKDSLLFGYTANYTPVKFDGEAEIGSIADIKITSSEKDFCIGTKM